MKFLDKIFGKSDKIEISPVMRDAISSAPLLIELSGLTKNNNLGFDEWKICLETTQKIETISNIEEIKKVIDKSINPDWDAETKTKYKKLMRSLFLCPLMVKDDPLGNGIPLTPEQIKKYSDVNNYLKIV